MGSRNGVDLRTGALGRRGAVCLALLGIVVAGGGRPAWPAPEPDVERAGTPLAGTFAVTETTEQIMARQAAEARGPRAESRIFFLGRADASGKKVDPAGEA